MTYKTDNVISTTGQEAADRVRVTDLSNQESYRNRIEGVTEGLEITNTGASTEYLQMLADNLEYMLNSAEVKEAMGEEYIFKFHREGDVPPAIMIPSLASRTVAVKMKNPYTNNTMPTKLTLSQGETIVSKPCEDAVMVSMAIERFDSEVDGVITKLHLQQEMAAIAEQLDVEVTVRTLDMLTNHANRGKYVKDTKIPVSGVPTWSARVDAVEDCIDAGLQGGRQFGMGIEDFIIGLDDVHYRAMQRAARRAGVTGEGEERGCAVSAYLGTSVYAYPARKDQQSVVIVPRRHTAISFRERADGQVFDFIVSRNAGKQSTTMEIVAVADILASGFTKMKKSDGTNIDVNLPLIQTFTFTAAP